MATAVRDEPSCPKCGGNMWDNRTTKRNPKAPDFKCRSRSCDGVVWPARESQNASRGNAGQSKPVAQPRDIGRMGVPELDEGLDEAPTASPAADRLKRIFTLQEACFNHAILMAERAQQNHDIGLTLEGISALTAQALIAFKEGR